MGKQLVSIIMVFCLMWILLPLTASAAELMHQISAGEYSISTSTQGLHEITMSTLNYGVIQSPGDPALPEKIVEIQVPDDIDWATVKITIQVQDSAVLPGVYTIAPKLPLMIGSEEYWGEGKRIVNGKNMNTYGRDANFPVESVKELPYTVRKEPFKIDAGEGNRSKVSLKTVHYIRLAYRPFLYNPVSQELTLIKAVTIHITYNSSSTIKSERMSSMRENDSLVRIQSNGGTYDYVIITTNDIVSNSERLDNFMHLKELEGHSVKVVTETDFGGLIGQFPNGTAEKIRQWLIDNEAALGIDYVLLIGDPDPDDPFDPVDYVGNIPMQYCWPNYLWWEGRENASYRGSPSDLFYADLTGNWDLDGDGIYGEGFDSTNPTSPFPADPLFDDDFSVEWTGQIECDFSETYRFHTLSDDGVELWIGTTQVINDWGAGVEPRNNRGDIYLNAGKHDITLKFHRQSGDGIVQLFWKTTAPEGDPNYLAEEKIPADHLYDAAGTTSGGLEATYYSNGNLTGTTHTRTDGPIDFVWATGDRGGGGPDTGADVYVGRIPVYNNAYAQLDDILGKIIAYETAGPAAIGWRESMLLPMAPLSDTTPAYHYGEAVKDDIAIPEGFSYYRIYWDDYSASGGPTPEDWPTSEIKVRTEWANAYGVVTWWTHGSSQGASHIFTSGSTGFLDDTRPSFTYQATCLNGYPENDNNLGYALLREGAVATVSATRVSIGSRGAWSYDSTSSANPNFGYKYIDHIVVDGDPAGMALYKAKGSVAEVDMNETNYNLYGDPTCYLMSTTPNAPPIADANGPYVADEGTAVVFDASASSDPEGDLLEYRWDFDNNGTWDTGWSSNPTATNTWCDNHTGAVKVEVRDQLGFTDEATASVTINNVTPSVNAGFDQTANEGNVLLFNGTFTDPGCDSWTYEWDFGDGSVVADTLTPTHAYGDNGVYTITLTVTDDDGGVGVDTLTVTVYNVPPTADIDEMIQPNSQFILPIVHTLTFNGSFTDPGWLDTHTSDWDFGDGTIISGILTEENNPPDATGTTTADHIYSHPGTYTVTLTITDDDGDIGADTMEVTVVDEFGALQDINEYIQNLPDSVFKGKAEQRKNALKNMISAINKMLVNKAYQGATSDLINNIRSKADGHVDGNMNNDWITDPDVQAELCMKIDDLVAYLAYLMSL